MKKVIDKIKKAPVKTGIYIFRGNKNIPLYIGRSINLSERLKYYLSSKDKKVKMLFKESKDLDYKIFNDILESIIEEARLIKKYDPKYNIKEKDGRSFLFIIISNNQWPYLKIVREKNLLGNERYVFGPFSSLQIAKNILLILRKIFPYSTCDLNQKKPCFHYQINLCPGKCIGKISQKEYLKNIKYIILILSGQKKKVLLLLKKENSEKLKLLETFDDSLLIKRENFDFTNLRIEGYDISHFSSKNTVGSMVVFNGSHFDKKSYRIFKIKNANLRDDVACLGEVIERRLKHKEWKKPDIILVDGGKSQVNIIKKNIKKYKVNILVLGISKYGRDKLILDDKIHISEDFFNNLKMIRDEAHRFSNSFRKKLSKKDFLS